MKSHYFESPAKRGGGNFLRRSPRKTKVAAGATLLTAMVSGSSSSSVLPVATAFCTTPIATSNKKPQPNNNNEKKRHAPMVVTPGSPSSPANNKKKQKQKETTTKRITSGSKSGSVAAANVRRTYSFEPVWSNRFCDTNTTAREGQAEDDDPASPAPSGVVPVHTLILGSHPSEESLSVNEYYGHPMNAFWWIAGDCLGFRRAEGISKSGSGKPLKFTKDLLYDENHILPYEQQLYKLTMSGFALWDIVGSCQRLGSLDQNIDKKTAQPNPIIEFCQQHQSTLRRIVIANGASGSNLFIRYFKDWLLFQQSQEKEEEGDGGGGCSEDDCENTNNHNTQQLPELLPLPNHEASQKHFASVIKKRKKMKMQQQQQKVVHEDDDDDDNNKSNDDDMKISDNNKTILLISAMAVSPANARYSYVEKRQDWMDNVYLPGLQDYEKYQKKTTKTQ